LYRAEYDSFEAYCRERWKMSYRHANRLIQAADVFDNVGPIGPIENERQARAIAHYEKDVQRVVVQLAHDTAPDGRISASHLKAVGTVLTGLLNEGGLDDGSGETKSLRVLLDASITEEVYERLKRQKEHIRQDADRKLRANASASEKATTAASDGPNASHAQEGAKNDTPQQSAEKRWRIIRDLINELDYHCHESGIKIRAQSFHSYQYAKALIGEGSEGLELMIDNYIALGKCEKCGEEDNVRVITITSHWANKIGTVCLRVCDDCLPTYQDAAGAVTDRRMHQLP
jgi:hypothetical protein